MHQYNHNTPSHLLTRHPRPSVDKTAFEVALKEKKQIAEGKIAFVFEKSNGFHLKAGQHIRITLIDPPETDRDGNSRFFSLASSPKKKSC